MSDTRIETLKEIFAIIGCEGVYPDSYEKWNIKGTADEVLERLRNFHEKQTQNSSMWDIPF